MKEVLTFLIFWVAVTPAVQAQFDPANLIPETLRYRMLSGSTEVGQSTVTIRHDSAAGMLHLVETISGLFEQTTTLSLRYDTTLQTLTSQTTLSRDSRQQQARLQYSDDGTRVTGEVQRPAEFGGQRAVDTELEAGTVDSYAVPYLLRCAPLAVGTNLSLPLFNGLKNEKGLARAWVARIEPVTVPAGQFECFRLEVYAGNTRLILNLATQFPHRIIRQIFPALDVKLELASISQ
ncbi:MAG: DUF3108 domain-containing protein [candidate division KSB1 bacterium]|nr:DUF3108 domain-containing protein [candidate division KSB1 bacterium]